MVGLRNLLIHEYATIDVEALYRYLSEIEDFVDFVRKVRPYIGWAVTKRVSLWAFVVLMPMILGNALFLSIFFSFRSTGNETWFCLLKRTIFT